MTPFENILIAIAIVFGSIAIAALLVWGYRRFMAKADRVVDEMFNPEDWRA